MSLIRARRERRDTGGSRVKPPISAGRLILLLALVLGLIWWLGGVTG